MKNKLKSVRRDSKTAAASQPKTAQSRAKARPTVKEACIALFPEGDDSASEEIIDLSKAEYAALKRAGSAGDGILMFMANAALNKIGAAPTNPGANHPSCLCLYDAGVRELAGEIPLVGRELPSVVIAAYRQRTSIDQFIAAAIREKLGLDHPSASTSAPIRIAVDVLIDLAVRKVQDCPIDEQICVWHALSQTLPDSAAREHAGQIAKLQSEVAARQLQFTDTLSGKAAQPSDQRRAA